MSPEAIANLYRDVSLRFKSSPSLMFLSEVLRPYSDYIMIKYFIRKEKIMDVDRNQLSEMNGYDFEKFIWIEEQMESKEFNHKTLHNLLSFTVDYEDSGLIITGECDKPKSVTLNDNRDLLIKFDEYPGIAIDLYQYKVNGIPRMIKYNKGILEVNLFMGFESVITEKNRRNSLIDIIEMINKSKRYF